MMLSSVGGYWIARSRSRAMTIETSEQTSRDLCDLWPGGLMHRGVARRHEPGLVVDHRHAPRPGIAERDVIEPRHRTVVDVEHHAARGSGADCERDRGPNRAAVSHRDDVLAGM